MPFNTQSARKLLQAFDFKPLFIEELGWDHFTGAALQIEVDDHNYALERIAEKRGVGAFLCRDIPVNAIRRKIEHQLTKQVREHLIIYTDPEQTIQKWQWVRRESGKPLACREHAFQKGQSGEALVQKLESLYVSFEEEERISTTDVTSRTRRAFDVERVTKAFYKRFQEEHKAFLGFIDGITAQGDKDWYASVMLNRLMFCYFIQKKGFLDGDSDYLRNRMQSLREQHGGEQFYSFYRYFLLRLFHEGLGDDEHNTGLEELIGKVPYLNGGLFAEHLIEQKHDIIVIEDAAFERVFDFFDQYHWHLDDRPLSSDKEINPDVLGYIFEKYINQKQMGAYYTKEDITEYISRSTIIPFLFDAAKKACSIAFRPESHMWRLLAEDPDRYIFDAVKYGSEHKLPENIAAGLDDVPKRGDWNTSAPTEYALPTEIWREVVARHKRHEEVRGKLAQGEVTNINDFITLNLDIRQFAEDVIANCEGPELLRAFWKALNKITVLDPTCGSGAFLFAALNILEPLYETCLERMEGFLEDLERSGEKHRPEKFSDFRKVLAEMAKHPNRRYFIYKSIILNNLYGVDLMEEAVEIAKLRLFLKLASLTDKDESKKNLGLEPLPDIDFNIRAGNTLVGFASLADVKRVMEGDMIKLLALPDIQEKAEDVESAYWLFREMQIEYGMDADDFHEAKQDLQDRLQKLNDELDRYMAEEYGISGQSIRNKKEYEKQFSQWKTRHQPFHWFVDFYGIMNDGGFDVIIGNPPYVEYSKIQRDYEVKGYKTLSSGNLFAFVVERSIGLIHAGSSFGLIVPISSISTPRMKALAATVNKESSSLFVSNFAVRPGKLFEGADMNLTIILAQKNHGNSCNVFSTKYQRWYSEFRGYLFQLLEYYPSLLDENVHSIMKMSNKSDEAIWGKVRHYPTLTNISSALKNDKIYIHSGGRYFRKCMSSRISNEYKPLNVPTSSKLQIISLLSSNLYYWFWLLVSDTYHVTKLDVNEFNFPESILSDSSLGKLGQHFLDDLWDNAETRNRNRADGTVNTEINFKVGKSKQIIDEIDRVLAQHYSFTDEELDFIINYDIKYRMGFGSGGDG